MARNLVHDYVFTPGAAGAGTVSIPGNIHLTRLLLITNVTRNTIIYNFSESTKPATVSYNSSTNRTTFTLGFSTQSMSATDQLQIYIEKDQTEITTSETLTDSTDKIRVTQPQSLIDTDFEYGTQLTKWENLGLINNRPFAYAAINPIPGINYILYPTGSRTVTIGLQAATPGTVGTPITVQDAFLNIANGNFLIESISGSGSTIFTYTGRAQNTTNITQVFDTNKTGIYTGSVYNNAQIGGTPTIIYVATRVTVTTTIPHGLGIGNEVAIQGTSASTNPPNGSFVVTRITSSNTFEVVVNAAPTGSVTGGGVYVRPQAQFLHRPFDGGVLFSSNANANYETAIRQTRRYFRYQSGKGLMVSSGTILKPNLQIDSMVGVGTVVTVITREQHNLQGSNNVVTIFGAEQPEYNGTFPVTGITGFNGFQYQTSSPVTSSPARGTFNASISEWYGCSNRLGMFDSQNGVFFEFDGKTLYACRRNSTFQISGKATVTNGSATITQTSSSFPTSFASQLDIGDFIVIRGQSYRVTDIASNTQFDISPAYRGTNAENVIISKTIDSKIPQSQWNIDRMNGTGPSGYNLDLTKMQMFYIDYSWYGAGYVRYGFRGADGKVTYCHKLQNNNVNTEAYMRSGNLPARYESTSFPPITKLRRALGEFDTTVGVASTAGFPSSGTLLVKNSTTYEYLNYTGITTDGFFGLTRAKPGVSSLNITISSGSNVGFAATNDLQIGQRVVSTSFPESTSITGIGTTSITFSSAATSANPTGVFVSPMGVTTGANLPYSVTDPVSVELAFPSFGPSISHWGTSVIMDGRFDDDKSLIFTYGQATSTNIGGNTTRALFSIRVAPSVDNGQIGAFGARELINRMQLTLRALDITTSTASANLLVRAYLNATPTSVTNWTNAVGNVSGAINSSFSQIADYAGGSVTVNGGEVIAGFFVGTGANSIDLTQVRDLGNSILGGGGAASNTQVFPDGPDTLTIVVTNLSTSTAAVVFGRLSWTEAQA